MKKLFYSVDSIINPRIGVILDKISEDKQSGHDIVFSYCDNALSSCNGNFDGNVGVCKFCHYMYKNIIKEYLNDTQIYPLVKSDKIYPKFDYSSFQEIRQLSHKGVNIGMSLMSFYISHTRDMDSPVTEELRRYFDSILNELCGFVDQASTLIEATRPDVIVIYNGRLYENKVFYELAMQKGIKFECLEVVGGPLWHEDKWYRVQYNGGLPHNIHIYNTQIMDVWKNSLDSEDEKIKKGSSFYYKRRTGQPAADIIFTKNMVENLLPDDYDKTKKNIVIFNSSDDEKAALGGEWDEGKLFPTQYDAIEFVVKNAPSDYHVYLRIHPNLSNIKYSYHTDLYKLSKYSNLTIIEPKSPISSYALMDIADKVVVFGSAMGVEGCFWGKPVLLLWKSLYYELDTCYVPKSPAELKEMLSENLKPKDKLNAIKYGYYNLDRTYRVEQGHYIDYNFQTVNFGGFKIPGIIEYLKICNSKVVYRFLSSFMYRCIFPMCKKKTPMPTKLLQGVQSAT